jgi:hypothetical protein
LPEPLLDFDDPLERLDPEDTDRDGEELREPVLDRVTLAGLLDLLPVDLERVTDDLFEPDLERVTLVGLLETEGLFPFLPDDTLGAEDFRFGAL